MTHLNHALLGKARKGIDNDQQLAICDFPQTYPQILWTGDVVKGMSFKAALNILQLDKTRKRSIKGKRKKAEWSNSYLAKLLKSFIVTGA